MTTRNADPTQDSIICAAADARLIIESGPGCGKTDVACARVAHLVEQGVAASRIVVLSFTRTAVREIRARVAQLTHLPAAAEADVRTLDSFTGFLQSGAAIQNGARPPRSYEESIRRTSALFTADNAFMVDALARYAHVIVDEAQDLVGDRAILIHRLLEALPPQCGWSVFLDPAQAIFEWSETGAKHAKRDSGFTNEVGLLEGQAGVRKYRLERVYRTTEKELLTLIGRARAFALAGGVDATSKIRRLAFEHESTSAGGRDRRNRPPVRSRSH